MRLAGKVSIVTGAAQGIGKATALKMSSEGATIVIGDINIDKANQVVEEIRKKGGKAAAFKADVNNRTEVKDLMKHVQEQFKAIHILVNNAGITRHAPLRDMLEEDWDAVLNTDLKGVFNCMQAVSPYMMQQRYGKIVSISSLSGMGHGRVTQANYAAAKGGVVQLTKVAARELGPYGINVNAIAPGIIFTDITITRRSKEEAERFMEEAKRITSLGRLGLPEDVANLAAFLASDEASFINGQVIRVDGGRTDGT